MPISGPFSGPYSSTLVRRRTGPGALPACTDQSFASRSSPADAPESVIVNHFGTVVNYIGGNKSAVSKNDGTNGSFDADAVSTASIAGDCEAIIDWAAGTFMAGLNSGDPTASSSYPSTFTVFLYWDAAGNQVYVMQYGNFVGLGHTWKPYGKITFNAAADTISVYTSDDRVNWGTALETFTGVTAGSLGSPHYFDSTISTSGGAFNAAFGLPAAITAYSLTADTATFTFTPQAVNLFRGYAMTASAATFTFSPQAVNLLRGYSMAAGTSSYAFTPQAANLTAAYKMTADAATFSFSPQAANLGLGKTLTATTMSISFSPQAVGLLQGYNLTADPATFAFNPQAITTQLHATLLANAALFSFTPQPSRFALNLFTMPPSSGGGGSGVKVAAVII